MAEIDTLKKFGNDFQIKCLSALLDPKKDLSGTGTGKAFLQQILDILHVDFFENESHKWIVITIGEYFQKYKDIPTMTVFKNELNSVSDVVTKQAVIESLRQVYANIDDSDLNYIRSAFLEFCKNQKLKSAILDSADLLKNGEYEKIKHTVDEALKAGMERDDGHDYMTEIDERLLEDCRDAVKTNWDVVDDLMDGGLGPGELGVFVAPAGIGKCVGPNTEIEIQYQELGIDFTRNDGSIFTLWIDPFNQYDMSGIINGVEKCFGWQVYNILWELENLKNNSSGNGKS